MSTKNAFIDLLPQEAPEPSSYLKHTENQFLKGQTAKHWARHDYWRLWEAMLLVLGLDPQYYSRRASHRNQLAKQTPSVPGLGGLLSNTELGIALENYAPLLSSNKSPQWFELYEILSRSERFVESQIQPSEFVAWANEKQLEIDSGLKDAVRTISGPLPVWGYEGNWSDDNEGFPRITYDGPKWLRDVEPLECPDDFDELKAPGGFAEKMQAKTQELNPKERDSLLRLVIGMAIEQYGYSPDSSRNAATKHIDTDLRATGVPLDRNTILKWLREGAELLPKA